MFDIGASELLVIVIVAILVIGPRDMPTALRHAGRWIGKLRRMSNHFRAGLDEVCLLYTSPSPRDKSSSRMPSSA